MKPFRSAFGLPAVSAACAAFSLFFASSVVSAQTALQTHPSSPGQRNYFSPTPSSTAPSSTLESGTWYGWKGMMGDSVLLAMGIGGAVLLRTGASEGTGVALLGTAVGGLILWGPIQHELVGNYRMIAPSAGVRVGSALVGAGIAVGIAALAVPADMRSASTLGVSAVFGAGAFAFVGGLVDDIVFARMPYNSDLRSATAGSGTRRARNTQRMQWAIAPLVSSTAYGAQWMMAHF